MHDLHLTQLQWIMALSAALCIGLAKSGLPGLGMITVLLMAEVLPARESTGTVLPLLICGDVFAVLIFQKHAHWNQIRKVLPPALVGVVAGYFLMQHIPADFFRPVIGWIVLILALLQFWRMKYPGTFSHIPHSKSFAWTMGGTSGITTMMANAAGPVMNIYLLAVSLPRLEFIGTSAWFFLIINIFKVPFSAHLGLINGFSIFLDIALVPAVLGGIWLGGRLTRVIPQKPFETMTLLLAAAAALRLILS